MAPGRDAEMIAKNAQPGVVQGVQINSGGWTQVGEFVARYAVYYRWGNDGKPIIKIVPVTQQQLPLVPLQFRHVRAANEHLGSGSRDE
jgi:hypothetical protein